MRPKPTKKPSLETPPRVPGDMAESDWSLYEVNFTQAPPMSLQAFGYTLRWSTRNSALRRNLWVSLGKFQTNAPALRHA